MSSAELSEDTVEVARVGPGRPRDPHVNDRLLEAARNELAERGVAAFSMRRVAERAGVSRPSLLLRWPDADSLIVDALDSLALPDLPNLPGRLEDDLIVLVDLVAEQFGSAMLDLQMRMVTEARAHPGLLERFQERVIKPTAARFDEVLSAAIDRGELSPATDRALLADGIIGVLLIRTSASKDRRPPGPEARRRLVRKIIRSVTTE
ncbi:TetR family transcriptional regulator [Gordonia sp. HNM0687]|uniref:TetR family transcriptional regulator n=1 Tax=Gordonia mangrovi TaxID=2665643 RepID=A0A6L7GWS3_9ACTN|nr:TetR/AcrR family transcriptional regulator [Gordonia mangrovi]MXP23471.1 TetR family transcriptional regulator [Gordonia mangrovi]UVF76633.1 TetR/AcrR family transcriptional regulator [Gordonia mangrovi]